MSRDDTVPRNGKVQDPNLIGPSVSVSTWEKVERAKQEWEATADALPELICLVDRDGNVIRANRTVEAWGLTTVTGVRGQPFHALIHSGCIDPGCPLQAFLREQLNARPEPPTHPLEYYDRYLGRDVQVIVRPVHIAKQQRPDTMVVVIRDITDRKRAEEALRRYVHRLEVINDIEQALLLAESSSEIAERTLEHIRRLIRYHWGTACQTRPDLGKMHILAAVGLGPAALKTGSIVPVSLISDMVQDDAVYVMPDLGRLRGPSLLERLLSEANIRSYMVIPLVTGRQFLGAILLGAQHAYAFSDEDRQIAHEVANVVSVAIRQAALFEQLQQTNRELQEALQAKDEMLQNVSHELRTPLTLIRGYLELVRSGGTGEVTAAMDEALAIMDHQSELLLRQVNRLLTMQSLERAEIERLPVSLSSWLSHVVQAWRPRVAQAGVRLELDIQDPLPRINVSPDLFNEVLTNLLENAVKFSPDGGTITIRAWMEGDEVRIAVSDQGIGIPPDQLERIFERFHQVDGSASRRFGGMGIGLALCRKIIDLHDGRIWATSEGTGRGSTFHIALPVSKELTLVG